MEKNLEIEDLGGGIECDNPECDWIDYTVTTEQLPSYLGIPCPKCGENLLTEEDLKLATDFELAVEKINKMTPEELENFAKLIPEEHMKTLMENFNGTNYEVSFHKKIKFKKLY